MKLPIIRVMNDVRCGLKLVYSGWYSDPLREERIGFPETAASLMRRIEPGTQFLIYVVRKGLVSAGETTGTLQDGFAKYGWGSGPFPLNLPCRLWVAVPAETKLSLGILGRRFYLVGKTWIDLDEKTQFERGRDALRLAGHPAA